MERVTVLCSSSQELQEWLEHLQPFSKGGSPAGTILKVKTHTYAHVAQSINSTTELKVNCKCENSHPAKVAHFYRTLI